MRLLTVQQIRDRVLSRHPAAAPLPDRPKLDHTLDEAGLEFYWSSTPGENGSYVNRLVANSSDLTNSTSISRFSAATGGIIREITLEEADARQFEESPQRDIREGRF